MSPTICPDFLWLFTCITMQTEYVFTHLPCSIIATGMFVTTFDNLWPVVTMGNWLDISGDHNHGNPGVTWLVTMPVKWVAHAHQMPYVMKMPGFSLGCIIHAVSHSQQSVAQSLGIQPLTPRVWHVAHNMYTGYSLPFIYLWRNNNNNKETSEMEY